MMSEQKKRTKDEKTRFSPVPTNRIWTIPNVISFLRIASIVLIAWLIWFSQPDHPDYLIWSLIVLSLSAASDGLDGYIARRFNQVTLLGQLLDPIADRMLIILTGIALCLANVIPWWMMLLIVARDATMLVLVLVLSDHHYGPLPVHFVGKTGTFMLMCAIPVLIISATLRSLNLYYAVHCFGLALFWWGIGLYWVAGVIYLMQGIRLLKADKVAKKAGIPLSREVGERA